MPVYTYRAARSSGAIVNGVISAESVRDAGEQLSARDLLLMSLSQRPPGALGRPASRADLAVLFRSIASLVEAGVPVERAVGATEPLVAPRLRVVLGSAREALRQGRPLSEALRSDDGAVPPLALGMLRAGERSSQLGDALTQVATHLELEAELGASLRQALAYPAVLVTAGTAMVAVIVTVVVPRFAEILGGDIARLPWSTRALLAVASGVREHAIVLVAAVVVGAALLLQAARTPAGRKHLHTTLLATPGIGPLRHTLSSARWSRTLGGALHAGMPALAALDAARDALGDAALSDRADRARERVARGERLADAVAREQVVAGPVIQLLAIGESSGALAAMAERGGLLAGRDAERRLRTLVTLLEPALVLLLGGAVAFVAAALLQAVYSVRPGGL